MNIEIREFARADRAWATEFLTERWGAIHVVSRGRRFDASTLPGFVALDDDRYVGLATYAIEENECQLITIDSLAKGRGIGTALLEAVAKTAEDAGCLRLWLITTNDNLDALRFYQRRAFSLVAVHRGAVESARGLKPEIPLTGLYDIPLRHEIELERPLGRS